ncbi:hypothetical protein [Erythrobacter aureus]|uniref:Uncharacterized protein n=1 Tax=Erythrobacter aureus TaxID=2182384 RepID=A0A345YIM0_9SPHN|nr:hypothetical protein [Erythrobacter aureus]AXK43772.1 hypothetical protein DVR09_15055 [Erythrobacter aureus]
MAKPEYLYSTQENNQALKDAAAAAGMPIKFDRDRRAYAMQTEGMSKEEVAEKKEALSEFRGEKARKAWAADRDAIDEQKATLKAEAKKRETTTKEPKKQRAPEPDTYKMFPAPSQKTEFRKLVRETSSRSTYMAANDNREAHYLVKTMEPKKFEAYMGDEAQARFKAEFAEKGGTPKNSSNEHTETARDEARKRGSKAFMAQYQDRGFRLSDPKHDKDNHKKQLNEMSSATTPQLLAVIGKSRDLVTELRDKEAGMRAEAAGLSVEQVKAMSFADQKKIAEKDGKPVGLVGDDFSQNVQLSRGIRAINAELESRGVRNKNAEQSQERGEQDKGQSNDKTQARTKGPAKVEKEESQDADFALMSAGFQNNRGGAGR